jgi:uncharacterized protein (TIGR02444 family)
VSADAELDGPHWRFALEFYAKPGVGEACLRLQDACGVDVNVLLVAIYAAARLGRTIGPAEIASLDAAAAPWRTRAVLPLRRLRRDLKGGVEETEAAEAEALREGVKALELKAEQIEQAILARRLTTLRPRGPAQDGDAAVDAAVGFYAGGTVSADVAEAVLAIKLAAAGGAP